MSQEERVKWDRRYREGIAPASPSSSLTGLEALLPATGRALDVGGGAGRHALWLARRGLDVTVTDTSAVALAIAVERAQAEGLSVHTELADLESDPLPRGPWDMIVVFHFLLRPLFRVFPRALAPRGVLVVVHPTRSNLVRHDTPGPAYLLEDGELPRLVTGLAVIHHDEGWGEEDRHEARVIARRAP